MANTKQAERAIFEAIRLEVVKIGYLPDATVIVGATPADKAAAWTTARDALKVGTFMNQLIDVLGVATTEGRDEKLMCRIVIDREGSQPGTIGAFAVQEHELTSGVEGEAGAKYRRVSAPSHSENVSYEISYMSNHIFMDRLMRTAIKNALKNRGYLPVYDDARVLVVDEWVQLEFDNEIDRTSEGMIERGMSYTAIDIWDEECQELATNVPSLDTITMGIEAAEAPNLNDLVFVGNWDPTTNTPTLADSTGVENQAYAVIADGTQDLGSGDITYKKATDVVYHNGIKWTKLNVE